jgi:hypothetical protein
MSPSIAEDRLPHAFPLKDDIRTRVLSNVSITVDQVGWRVRLTGL